MRRNPASGRGGAARGLLVSVRAVCEEDQRPLTSSNRMIITCPSCATRYSVEASGFAPSGRKVRCAKCGHGWHQVPEAAEDVAWSDPEDDPGQDQSAEDSAAPPPPPVPKKKKPARPAAEAEPETVKRRMPMKPRRSPAVIAAGWVLLAAFVGGTAFGVAAYQTEIVKFWPATEALYAAFNEADGLEKTTFKNVSYKYEFEDGLPVLAIRGEIVNEGAARVALRPVQVDLRGDARQPLYHWTFRVPETALEPSQRAEFVTRLSSPPLEARDLVIRFVREEDAAHAQRGSGR